MYIPYPEWIDYFPEIDPAVLLALAVVGAYFFPAFVAGMRGHHNGGAIFALNLLLGWTLLGWVAAMVWSLTRPR